MEKATQHQKIIDMCIDGQWHCGNEFREAFIFSPHKRRIEIEGRKNRNEKPTGKFLFLERKCEHDSQGVKDYLMVENDKWVDPTPPKREVVVVERNGSQVALFT